MTIRLRPIEITARPLAWLLIAGLSLTSLMISHDRGADYKRYRAWSQVFLTGDIFELPPSLATPTGLPLTQWSFGPGLMFAVPDALGLPAGTGASSLTLFGLGSFFMTWLGVLLLLPPACKKSLFATVSSLLVIFFGSHAGFYSHHHSSESLSILLVVWMAVFLKDGGYQSLWKASSFFLIGALLCLCRLKFAPIVAALLTTGRF
jgi:hypothetical protein